MFNFQSNASKIIDANNLIATVSTTISSDVHMNNLLNAAHTIMTGEFVLHMSQVSIANPKKFQHMYEWGRVGDPNSRLWKHTLKGRGKLRSTVFEFKASKKTVPVDPKLAEVGVKQNHIFYWKAPILEYGLPVKIYPKIAKALAYLEKPGHGQGTVSGSSFSSGGVIYTKGTVNIPRAGSPEMWGSFTEEYTRWFNSDSPNNAISQQLTSKTQKIIKSKFLSKLSQIIKTKKKEKSFTIQVKTNQDFQQELNASLAKDYSAAAANRRMVSDD